jgi:hypothetical protein
VGDARGSNLCDELRQQAGIPHIRFVQDGTVGQPFPPPA